MATQNQLSVGLNIRSSLTADFKLTQYARFEPSAHFESHQVLSLMPIGIVYFTIPATNSLTKAVITCIQT